MRGLNSVFLLSVWSFSTGAFAVPSVDLSMYEKRLTAEGDQNRVLNQMEIGTRRFWSGDIDGAAESFDDAIARIELVYRKDEAATKARSLWHDEGAKVFKGEPYERTMVYYYRGLCYLRKGDYENARAAFRQGQMQDAFAEEEQSQADFAILLFLEAWASHLNGDRDIRDEALKQLKVFRPDFPGIANEDNTLVLAETGTSPRKLGDGMDHSYFVYRRGKGFTENRAELAVGETRVPLYPMEDIYWQASTRGGREVDKILKGKASFKKTTTGVATGFANGSALISQMGGGGAISGAAAGIGAIAFFVSVKAKPKADTRQWASLPDTIHVRSLPSSRVSGAEPLVEYLSGSAPTELTGQTVKVETDPRGNRIVFARAR